MAIGRWIDGKRQARKGKARVERELVEKTAELAASVDEASQRTAARLLAAQPHLGELSSRVDIGDPRVWERRLTHDDFLEVTLGYGSRPFSPDTDDKPYGPLIDVLAKARLHGVPLTAPLGRQPAIGLAGDEEAARSLARAVLTEGVVLHGPADMQCAVISSDPMAWAWAKWLPHIVDDRGDIRVATDEDSAIRILDALTPIDRNEPQPFGGDRRPETATVLVLDGDETIDAYTVRAAEASFANPDLRVVAIGSKPDQLPSFCATIVTVDGGGNLRISDPQGRFPDLTGAAVLVSAATAERVARRLGRLDDPERSSASGAIPTYTALEELLSTADLTGADVVSRWNEHRSHKRRHKGLDAVVGVTQDGPFSFDIVRDGPHAVIAGTTGSGKSELLRSWVGSMASSISPERVNFVLVDFKGGGAFDACNEFPHTVGVVTDLDEHLSARALRCLQAELKYRELRLRGAGASSIEEYWEEEPSNPLPRLLLIVDEFATLAQELPEFLTSLVDVAQRGRSLGIHMVLATQRPAGVLDAKIKANTNLRIALRVQDDGDSVDVIGVKAAAELDRRTPGRALARLGASEIVAFQTALVTVATDRTLRHSVEVTPFGIGEAMRTASTATADPDAPSDLEQLVDAAVEANRLLGLAPARVPWPDPLPDAIDLVDLPEPAAEAADRGWYVQIGL
ncbi:MAG: FtsK/SpoIIIE domain-containing protein, partial [Actinomycetota bacterium]